MDSSAQSSPTAKKLGLLAFVMVLVLGTIGTAAIFIIKGQRLDAARFLRPQETVAVFTHAEQNTWKAYAHMLPVLDLVPPITSHKATLVVIKRGNTMGWVLLGESPLTETKGQLAFATPVVAYGSSFSDWKPAEENETTLESYPPFLQLLGQAPKDVSVAYMDMQLLKAQSRTPLDDLLLNGAKQWPTVLVWKQGPQTQLLLYGHNSKPSGVFAPPLPEPQRSHLLTVSFGDGTTVWDALTAFLPERERLILQGRLGAHITKTLGTDVSLQYDLLPLMKKGAALSLTHSGFLLEGLSNSIETEKSLTRIMESVQQSMPQSAVDKHVFERGFTSTIISPSGSAIVERRQSQDGFDVHTIWSVPQNRGIALARKGSIFRLASDFSLLMPATSTDVPTITTPPVSPLAQAEALLWVRKASAQTLLEEILGIPDASDILPSANTLLIALRREGTFTRLVIDQQP